MSSRGRLQIYILADTTYNSLSVDEVAAAHIGAECIVSWPPSLHRPPTAAALTQLASL